MSGQVCLKAESWHSGDAGAGGCATRDTIQKFE